MEGDAISSSRILAAKKGKLSDKEKIKKMLKDPLFISTTLNLKDFKLEFAGAGINPLKDNAKSSINKTAYSNFQKKLQKDQLNQMSSKKTETEPQKAPAPAPKSIAETKKTVAKETGAK